MDVLSFPISTTAVISIIVLGNLIPLALIAGIYWYMTRGNVAKPLGFSAPPAPIELTRRVRRAA